MALAKSSCICRKIIGWCPTKTFQFFLHVQEICRKSPANCTKWPWFRQYFLHLAYIIHNRTSSFVWSMFIGKLSSHGSLWTAGDNVHSRQSRLLHNLEQSYCAFVHHKHYTCISVSLERSRRITLMHISQRFCVCIHSANNNILESHQVMGPD